MCNCWEVRCKNTPPQQAHENGSNALRANGNCSAVNFQVHLDQFVRPELASIRQALCDTSPRTPTVRVQGDVSHFVGLFEAPFRSIFSIKKKCNVESECNIFLVGHRRAQRINTIEFHCAECLLLRSQKNKLHGGG